MLFFVVGGGEGGGERKGNNVRVVSPSIATRREINHHCLK